MAIVKHNPLRELRSMQDHMSRLLDLACSRESAEEPGEGVWQPFVDIMESDEVVVIMVELPGVDQKDIDVKIEDTTLTIRGERKQAPDVRKELLCHRIERCYGPFQRSFYLPHTIEPEKASAACNNGVLTITLPKKADSMTRPITVKVE